MRRKEPAAQCRLRQTGLQLEGKGNVHRSLDIEKGSVKLEKDPSLSIWFSSMPSIVDTVIIFFENPCIIASTLSVKVKRKEMEHGGE